MQSVSERNYVTPPRARSSVRGWRIFRAIVHMLGGIGLAALCTWARPEEGLRGIEATSVSYWVGTSSFAIGVAGGIAVFCYALIRLMYVIYEREELLEAEATLAKIGAWRRLEVMCEIGLGALLTGISVVIDYKYFYDKVWRDLGLTETGEVLCCFCATGSLTLYFRAVSRLHRLRGKNAADPESK